MVVFISIKTSFLILIAVVLLTSIMFAVLFWRQSVRFEKKALAAKQKRDKLIEQIEKGQVNKSKT